MVKIERKLGRTPSHRQALMRIMVTNLIRVEQMRTTLPKAKELRRHADRVITLAKKGGVQNYRRAMSFLNDKTMVNKLFNELSPRFANRSGGYTRVLRAGVRPSDNAQMAIIEYLQPGFVSVSKGPLKNGIVPPSWVQPVGTSTPSSSSTPDIIIPNQ